SKLYLAATADLVKAGKAGVKPTVLADVDPAQDFPEAVFLPDHDVWVAAVTTGGLKEVRVTDKRARGKKVGPPDVRHLSIHRSGQWLFVTAKDTVTVLPWGAKQLKPWKLAGVRFGAWGEDNLSAIVVKDPTNDVLEVDLHTGKTKLLVSGADIKK